jgi:heme exporter protein B
MMSGWQTLKRQFQREFWICYRDPRQLIYASVFFLMVLIFFPLTISSEPDLLRSITPGLVWVDLLFAIFLSSERLFQADYDDGVIEQWLVSGYAIHVLVSIKIWMHWVMNISPLLLLCPLMGVFLHLSMNEICILIFCLIVGTPAISFLCALASALSAGLKQNGIITALIIFPLTIPVMIFGSGTLFSALHAQAVSGYLAILSAMSLLTAALLPFAIVSVVKLNLCD